MKTEPVTALVLMNSERDNTLIVRLGSEYFGVDPEPFATCDSTAVITR